MQICLKMISRKLQNEFKTWRLTTTCADIPLHGVAFRRRASIGIRDGTLGAARRPYYAATCLNPLLCLKTDHTGRLPTHLQKLSRTKFMQMRLIGNSHWSNIEMQFQFEF